MGDPYCAGLIVRDRAFPTFGGSRVAGSAWDEGRSKRGLMLPPATTSRNRMPDLVLLLVASMRVAAARYAPRERASTGQGPSGKCMVALGVTD